MSSNDLPTLDGTIEWDELHPLTQGLLMSRRGLVKMSLFGALTVVVAACGDDKGSSSTTTAAPTTTAGAASLYTRLGGNAAISAVITDFVDNQVVPDAQINHFFAKTDLTRLKQLLTEFTDSATGGPEKYTGRSMKDAHAGMGVTMADFNALVADLGKSLAKFNVPAKEQGELVAALAPLSTDIVTA